MLEWIEENKEWIFSGAGIAAVSAVVAIVSAVLTYWFRLRLEKRRRKQATLQNSLKSYRIGDDSDDKNLEVSYQGKSYSNLCQYQTEFTNTGSIAIENQQLLFRFPRDTKIVEDSKKFSTNTIGSSADEVTGESELEIVHTLNRLEPGDSASFSFLLDTSQSNRIECLPRGVDEIDYSTTANAAASEAQKLVAYAALFVLMGAMPFFESVFQAGVILAAGPTLLSFSRTVASRRKGQNRLITTEISAVEGGTINIKQA